MKENVWIINHYATSMLINGGGRHYFIAKQLQKLGYKTTIFSSNAIHNSSGKLYKEDIALWEVVNAENINIPFVLIKSRAYINNGIKRLFNIIDFYHNVIKAAKEYANMTAYPDVVYASSVHPLSLVAGIKLARFFKIPCICEIRDLWPESLISYGVLKKRSVIAKLLRSLERWIYLKSNAIIFTMPGGYDYIKDQKWSLQIPREKVYYVNNGVDLKEFEYNKTHFKLDDVDLHDLNAFKVIYTGSIRKANRLDLLIRAASELKSTSVKILIWGEGDEEDTLKAYIKEQNISNVVFKGSIQRKWIPFIISCADANFIDPFDERISQYGISSNKLFEYLAAGKPIIMNRLANYNPILSSDCYVEYDNSPKSIANTINSLMVLSQDDYLQKCENAKCAANDFSYDNLTKEIQNIIEAF